MEITIKGTPEEIKELQESESIQFELDAEKFVEANKDNFIKESEETKSAKEHYLNKFKRNNDVSKLGFSLESEKTGKKIVAELKKRGLTYDDAYASLQWAYNRLNYESNFLDIE